MKNRSLGLLLLVFLLCLLPALVVSLTVDRGVVAQDGPVLPPGRTLLRNFDPAIPISLRITNRGDCTAHVELFELTAQQGLALVDHRLDVGCTVDLDQLTPLVGSMRVTVDDQGSIGASLIVEDLLPNSHPFAAYWARSEGGDLYSTSTGRVGIGTNSPRARLDVEGDIAISGLTVIDSSGRYVGHTPALNPKRIASERWFEINRTGITVALASPREFVCDGKDFWVGGGDGFLTRIKTGPAAIGEQIEVGHDATRVAYDGANFWVASLSGQVTKIRRRDGAVLASLSFAGEIGDLLFDGKHIWATLSREDEVARIDARTATDLGSIPVGNFPLGMAFDGQTLWVANPLSKDLSRIRVLDAVDLGAVPADPGPAYLAYDGAHLWVLNASRRVDKRAVPSGDLLERVEVPGLFFSTDILFDGSAIWVVGTDPDETDLVTVGKIRPGDAHLIDVLQEPAHGPARLGFDGVDVWVSQPVSGALRKL
jgi:hypothetical protein